MKKLGIVTLLASLLLLLPATGLGNSISNIQFATPSPAAFHHNDHVDVTFDYETDYSPGARIWIRPYTEGSLTPHQVSSGSPLYVPGSGSGSGWFTITDGEVTVDQVHFSMYDNDGSVILLFEVFVDVTYNFSASNPSQRTTWGTIKALYR